MAIYAIFHPYRPCVLRSGSTLAEAACAQPITAFAALPNSNSGAAAPLTAISGYRDGVVRVYTHCATAAASSELRLAGLPQGLALTGVAKPHKGAVTALAVSQDAARLATCGEDGTVFFFDIMAGEAGGKAKMADSTTGPAACGVLLPRAFVRLGQGSGTVTCATWDGAGQMLLAGTSRGTILQVGGGLLLVGQWHNARLRVRVEQTHRVHNCGEHGMRGAPLWVRTIPCVCL